MSFSHKYNTDDVIIRAAIVGLINELNNRIYFYNTWDDNKKQIIRIPFFYAMSGDERFLQDAFSNWNDCYPDFIEGNTDPIPRGMIFLTGVSILSENLTSRFVRGYYTKEIEGQLQRFNSYINSIPIQLNFSAEILTDTTLDSFKIIQSAITVLYRTLVFSVNYNGFRVPTQAGFPDSYTPNKQFEFTYGETERLKVSFEIECQTYLPIPNETDEFFAGNNISRGIVFNINSELSNTADTTQMIVTPIDVPNISPNEEVYINPKTDTNLGQSGSDQSNSNQFTSTQGEGPVGNAENYTGDYWR